MKKSISWSLSYLTLKKNFRSLIMGPRWCMNYDSGNYEWIDEYGYSLDRGEFVYNYDHGEFDDDDDDYDDDDD